jgi:hypothetical protein
MRIIFSQRIFCQKFFFKKIKQKTFKRTEFFCIFGGYHQASPQKQQKYLLLKGPPKDKKHFLDCKRVLKTRFMENNYESFDYAMKYSGFLRKTLQ